MKHGLSHQDSVGNFCKSSGRVCWVEPSERVGARPGGGGERLLQGYRMRARSKERGPVLCLLFPQRKGQVEDWGGAVPERMEAGDREGVMTSISF